jgi:hypothetical protein
MTTGSFWPGLSHHATVVTNQKISKACYFRKLGAALICSLGLICTAQAEHYFCYSPQPLSKTYLTAEFDAAQAGAASANTAQVSNAFREFLTTKYGVRGGAVCFGDSGGMAAVQASQKQTLSVMRTSRKWNIVDTGWKYAGGAASAQQPTTLSQAATNHGPVSNIPSASQPVTSSPLNAKISEVKLGPSKQSGMYVVSPDGGHLAVFDMHGSRELIVVDGVDGPEFDHAAHAYTVGAIDVSFNSDGKHSAYIAQKGDELVAVVDGKTRTVVATSVAKGGTVAAIDGSFTYLTARSPGHQVLLSPSGLHFACVGQAGSSSNMYLDGAKSQNYSSIDVRQVAFVNDHLVYAAYTPTQKWHMYVDDRPGPAYDSVSSLVVSEDNKHYAFIAGVSGGKMAVVDGVAGPVHKSIANGVHDLVIAANGRVAYLADEGGGSEPFREALYIGSQLMAPNVSPFTMIDKFGVVHSSVRVVFSPDGRKFAYAKTVPGGVAAVIDGTVSRAYDGIGIIQFAPDSQHAFFVGIRGMSFVVLNGKEMEGQNRVENFVFSVDSRRFAYEAYSAQTGFHVVIDGQVSPRFYNILPHTLSFSPDSKHSIYGACTNYLHCQVVEDGNVTNIPSVSDFRTRTMSPATEFPTVLFSPDSSRLAYAYPKSDGTSQNVYIVNGQEIVHGTSFEFPSFSPNSTHFAVMGWNGRGYTLFVDGKSGPACEDLVEANMNVARFVDAHTYRFLGTKDGGVYRVTVDFGE